MEEALKQTVQIPRKTLIEESKEIEYTSEVVSGQHHDK